MSSIFGYNSRPFPSRTCACPSPTAPAICISSATPVSKAGSSSPSPCPGSPAASASAPAPSVNRSAASSSSVRSASSVAAKPATSLTCSCPMRFAAFARFHPRPRPRPPAAIRQSESTRLPQDPRPPPIHPPPRTRPLFLLSAPHRRPRPVPRPRRAPRPGRAQLLSQPGFLLPRMQFAQRRAPRRQFSPLALPRAPHHLRRTQRPSPRPRRPRLRQAPPSRPSPRHPFTRFTQSLEGSESEGLAILAGPVWRATHHRPSWPPTRLAKRPVGARYRRFRAAARSEEHTSELQSLAYLVCRLLLEKKKNNTFTPVNIMTNKITKTR